MDKLTYAELNAWEGKLHNACKRLDKMETKDEPDANILSYELAVMKQQITEKIEQVDM